MSIVSAIQSNFQLLSKCWPSQLSSSSPQPKVTDTDPLTETETETATAEVFNEKPALETTPQIYFKRPATSTNTNDVNDANDGEQVSAAQSQIASQHAYPISLILPAPTIDNMVFSGAGARSVVLPAALSVLDKKIFESLKHASGASSGALVATGIASSHSPEALDQILAEDPIHTLKEDVPNFGTLYPGVTFQNAPVKPGLCNKIVYFARVALLKLLTGDGPNCSAQRAFQIVDQITTRPIANYLQAHWEEIKKQEADGAADSKLFTAEEMTRLEDLKRHSEADFQKDRTGKLVTFGDLSLMHRLDPSQFKDLTVVVWNQTQDKAVALSTTNPQAHDIAIALAVRMSISIPLYFQPVDYKKEIYEDGGFKDRIPVEVFFDKGEIANTLVTDFYDNGDIYSKMYQKPLSGPDKSFKTQFTSWLIDYPQYGKTVAADNAKIYKAGPALYTINNGNIGDAYALNVPPQAQEQSKRLATADMHHQVAMREDQAYALDAKNADEAIKLLTPAQKKEVAASPSPRREDYRSDQEFKAIERFYNLAKKASRQVSFGEVNVIECA